jgi:uncharacterized protein YndB with AHSA1/START domain
MTHDGSASWTCRDARTIAAPIERCFATLSDLATYPLWWSLVHVTRDDGGESQLAPGAHLRFDGARPGGTSVAWTAAVRAIDAPRRIVLAYDGGSLVGDTAWELDEAPGGTTIAYRYLGVRGNEEHSRATFARFGTKLHSLAMQHDALAGLERHLVDGASADDAWRAHVNHTIAAALRPHRT